MSSKLIIAAITVSAAVFAAAPSTATIIGDLPAVTADQYTNIYRRGENEIRNNGLGTVGDANRTASSLFSPNAQVSVTAAPGYIAVARLSYSFQLTGSTFAVVPLIAYGSLRASLTGAGQVDASLVVDNGAYGFSGDSLYLTRFNQGSLARDAVVHFEAITGVIGRVNLTADVVSFGGYGSAFVDPYIIIDPAYAAVDRDYLQNFALSFSDGVGNVAPPGFVPPLAAVPEPAAWALMLTGFALVGGAARRRGPAAQVAA